MIEKIKLPSVIGLCSVFLGISFISSGINYLEVVRAFIFLYGVIITVLTVVSIGIYLAENQ